MKEFTIEDFEIDWVNNSVKIDFHFYSTLRSIEINEERLSELLNTGDITLTDYLCNEFNEDDCIILLTHLIRDYAPKKQKIQ